MTRVLVIEHETGAGLGRLTPADDVGTGTPAGAEITIWRPYLGQPAPIAPEALDGFDALVVLGGSMGAHDDHVAEWLPITRQVLAAAVERQMPTLGICLGAQLLAAATGGTVERGAPGLAVGLIEIRPTAAAADDPVIGALGALRPVGHQAVEYHYAAVTVLPPGAVLLETSDMYPHQGYRLGPCAWAVQYHPEVTSSDFRQWVSSDEAALLQAGRDPQVQIDSVAALDGDLQFDADALWRAWFAQVQVRTRGDQRAGVPALP